MFLSLLVSSCGKEEIQEPIIPIEPEVPEIEMEVEPEGTMRDITSMELVAEMGIGWNLGNSFDVRAADKTNWGNPLPSGTHIKAVKDMGFGTLRIPITWGFNQQKSSPYTIQDSYLLEIQEIVDEALENKMHVIINTHHDDWIIPTTTNATVVKERLSKLWSQVATHFQAYGDHLIFEVMNEPRLLDSPEEWTGGTQEGRKIINEFHKAGVDAIRNTGGNNTKRHIMISTYAASSTADAMRDLEIPNNDPNIIISIHSYFPWSFAGQEDGPNSWGSDEEKTALTNELDWIRDRWIIQEKRPVILGEWGTINKNNTEARTVYAAFYANAAVERGMLPIIWDDGGNFGLYNRHSNTWKYPEIAKEIVAAGK